MITSHEYYFLERVMKVLRTALFATVRKSAPRAKMVLASTTPLRKDKSPGPANERIDARNRIAREFFEKQNIAIHADVHSDDVHFNPEGSKLPAAQVEASVEKVLGAK
jgi:hypothetical protein